MEILLVLVVIGAILALGVQASNARAGIARERAKGTIDAELSARRAMAAEYHAGQATQRAAAAEQHAAQATQRAVSAEQYAASMARYQNIPNAEVYATELRARAANDAQALSRDATANADKMVSEARGTVDQLTREAARLEASVRALKNITDGYGNAYVLPTTGLLDDLAEHFGHTEAGANLKAARARTKAMIKSGTAATCDYVELGRRQTAMRFVIDAFNGKVDTILADSKEDNYGTLAQKIRDASALVNENGAAFRDARIQPAYIDARLEELKWAVIAQELRAQEREEQRAMRERMRDEERAQKEIERALKEAEKEESLLHKALEKARREVAESNDADRARFEAKLNELNEKLREAEEKGQRAISMAQQTKAGHVYVISNIGSFGEHVYKIGMTRRLEPTDRVRELGDASVPFEFDVHAMIRAEDAPGLECALHKAFVANQVNKVNSRKEFFRVSLDEVRKKLEELGIDASWTMTAACRQYQETLALERALARGDGTAREWRREQLRTIEQDAKTATVSAREEELAEA